MRALDQVMHFLSETKRMLTIRNDRKAEIAACNIVKNIFDSAPVLGLDLDGTIDEAPEFFKYLSNIWPGMVIIITVRKDEIKAKRDAENFGVYFDKLITVKRLEDKAQIIKDLGINVYVDDQDECMKMVPENVTILKIRNGGNFENNKWLYSSETGKQIC